MRLHLFEFIDQTWFPETFRALITDYLVFVHERIESEKSFSPHIEKLLKHYKTNKIVDLCSGSGGAIVGLAKHWDKKGLEVDVEVTDLYPSEDKMQKLKNKSASVKYCTEPVDASDVPADKQGVRSFFLGFHHLKESSAKAVLLDAQEKSQGICVFEITKRNTANILSSPIGFLAFLLVVPFLRPKPIQLIFTYLIPVIPVAFFWDALVSHLRTYSMSDLERMVDDIKSPDYRWEIGEVKLKGLPYNSPYIIGCSASPQY